MSDWQPRLRRHARSSKDEFNKRAINTRLWDTSNLTSGVRWCSSVPGSLFDPGSWIDPIQQGCFGQSATTPYGSAAPFEGALSRSASIGRTFPYLRAWENPFTATGDFRLTVRLRVDSSQSNGTGLAAPESADPLPANGNIPFGNGTILRIWQDGVHVLDQRMTATPAGYHVYRLDYTDGTYTFYIDEVQVGSPLASALRPTSLWLGNPVFAWWINDDWTDVSVDSIATYALR